MHTRSINIENNTNQIVLIAYREPAGAIIEKVLPHQSLTLSSATSFLAIRNGGRIQKFPMQYRRYHFIIESAETIIKTN